MSKMIWIYLNRSLITGLLAVSLTNTANIYLFKVSSKSTNKSCDICSKLTIKALAQRQWHRSDVFIVNFEHISHLFSSVSILDLELVNASWEYFCGTLSRCLTLRPLKRKSKRWTWDQPCQTFMMKLFSICFSIRTYSIQPL